ncbi:hypothetical protein [Paenibacillus sp. E194]|nr:hypothetical protein [Paenibacillus sp. E194]
MNKRRQCVVWQSVSYVEPVIAYVELMPRLYQACAKPKLLFVREITWLLI